MYSEQTILNCAKITQISTDVLKMWALGSQTWFPGFWPTL